MELGYINGQYVKLGEKVIPLDERGHQFGDGVYEVIRFYDGKPFMLKEHLERLINSAHAIRLSLNQTLEELTTLILDGVGRANIKECNVYIQITRGIATRNHLFPDVPVSISMTIRNAKIISDELRGNGVTAISHPDERWANCYIKSLNLLPNILAKQTAHEQGCYEAILYKDGYVTEGTASNIFAILNGKVYTTPLNHHILPGITRMAVKDIAERQGVLFVEKHLTMEEILASDEVFLTSTTSELLSVIKIDGQLIGDGKPGKWTKFLHEQYKELVKNL